MQANSLTVRLVAGAALWSLIALAGVWLVLSSLFRDSAERAFDARLIVVLETLVAGADVRPDGQLRLQSTLGDPRFDQALSGWYWQIEGPRGVGAPTGPDMRSRSLWDRVIEAPERRFRGDLARGTMDGPDGQRLRVIARDIILPGSDLPFAFTVAGDSIELDREIARFNRLLGSALLALGVGLVLGIIVLVRVGLAPLRRVSRALNAIRAGRAARLEGQFPSEIEPLAAELNALVEHNAALLERARRHVGNLAHALKTPISVLTNEAQAMDTPGRDALLKQLANMRAQVDHHLSRARMAAAGGLLTSRTNVVPVLGDLERTLKRIYAERSIATSIDAPEGLSFRGEQEDFEEMAGNLMDNAFKWARAAIRVTAAPAENVGGAALVLTIEDDGPGLSEDAIRMVLKRGMRLDESVPGSGLGLSIVRDIAELYGGTLTLGRSALGGLSAQLRLPGADALPPARVAA